jgi:hypothetical protein
MTIWNILQAFEILCDHLVHISGFGIMYQEKSGNPDLDTAATGRLSMTISETRLGRDSKLFRLW